MSVVVQCDALPLSLKQVENLWKEARAYRRYAAIDAVTVRCVDEVEITGLNRRYRHVARPTNVLTFSYDGEHDVALCLPVAEREAQARDVLLDEYVALLLVHAFLHATGLDHEQSAANVKETRTAEETILARSGFRAESL